MADLNFAGAQIARRAAEDYAASPANRGAERRRFVAGAMGPTSRTASMSQDVSNPGGARRDLRPIARPIRDSGASARRRRRGPAAARNGVRHAQRQGGAVRHRGILRGQRQPRARDRFRHHCRSQRAHAFRPNGGSVLDLGFAHAAFQRGNELRARRETDAPVSRGAFRPRAGAAHVLSECGAAQRVWRLRRNARTHGRRPGRICAQRLAEHRRRLLRFDARAYPRNRRSDPRRGPARRYRSRRRIRDSAASSRW